jgi:hypothetical protein
MYPNSALPVWELLVMTSVPVALLMLWIIVVRLAGRDGSRCSCPEYDSFRKIEAAAGAEEEMWRDADQRAA